MIEHAFLRIETVDDLHDLVALLRRGAVVGFEPVVGSLFGPVLPCRLERRNVPAALYWVPKKTTDRPRLEVIPAGFLDWLWMYLDERRSFETLRIHDATPEIDMIERAWRILNHGAGIPLTGPIIVELVLLIAEHLGGIVLPQMSYGAPGWIEFTKSGNGWLTMWSKPSMTEMMEIVEAAPVGLINANEASSRRPWFAGMSGPHLLPNRGLVRVVPGASAEATWEASGDPTGLGGQWDRVAAYYRLCGLVAPSELELEAVKVTALAVRRHARREEQLPPADEPVTMPHKLPATADAALWLHANWSKWTQVNLTGPKA